MAHSSTPSKELPSVTIVVLAFNEARNLPSTIKALEEATQGKFSKYETIIVNDGSQDNTGEVAESLAETNPGIKVLHNDRNMGCGFTFMRGARAAENEYTWLIPGDGEITIGSMESIASHIGEADMILPYALNNGVRPLWRRITSRGYTTLLNILFGHRLRYYNGPAVFRTELLKPIDTVYSRGFVFMAPIILRLLKRKCTYVQVGILLQPRKYGNPSFNLCFSILGALKTILGLFWSINIVSNLNRENKAPTTE